MLRLTLAAILFGALIVPAAAQDKRVGYYYPEITSQEVFTRVLRTPPPATTAVRTNFIVEITRAQLAAPENPRFSVFAKGSDAKHMIVIALDDQIFRTLYRARGQLAQLTANARGTEFFRNNDLQVDATWFDLSKMLGFEDIVISDGVTWAHKVLLQ